MKKIITLFFTTMSFAAAFAQYNSNNQWDNKNNRDVVKTDDRRGYDKGNNNFDRGNSFSKEREMQINQINREYDQKIQAVKFKFFMSRFQKERMISKLEDQRQYEIHMVMAKFNDKKGHYGYDKDRW